MKWSIDLAVAVALTVFVWTAFYLTFPNEPLGAGETVFVLAVFYGLVKLVVLARKHLGSNQKVDSK
ncbi:hypothetical protein [Pelagibius sp. Alg239-R121]|uniref:hypothetical protein n=1 Tax=Pelagibius sp. Alg239-R121 TaxID=2993448 RepID=UPI0024A6829F|nr:hypothetical protein [Pelagibius sp. Alg239-R121]